MDAWLKKANPNAKSAASSSGAAQTNGAPSDGKQASTSTSDGTFPKIKVKSTAAPLGESEQTCVEVVWVVVLMLCMLRPCKTTLGRKVQTEEHRRRDRSRSHDGRIEEDIRQRKCMD